MLRFALNRAGLAVLVVITTFSFTFFLMRGFGDPISSIVGDRVSEEELARRLAEAGLDRPLLVQYFEGLLGVLTLDFGTSLIDGKAPVDVFFDTFPATLEITIAGLLIAWPLAAFLARRASIRPGGFLDKNLSGIGAVAFALPGFAVALFLRMAFSIWLPLFPVGGRADISTLSILDGSERVTGFFTLDSILALRPDLLLVSLHHLALPALTIALSITGIFASAIRNNIRGVEKSYFAVSAKGFGLSKDEQVKHWLYPAIRPDIFMLLGVQLMVMLNGLVLTERAFNYQGMGLEIVERAVSKDFVMVQGMIVCISIVIVLTNSVLDVAAFRTDPRVRRRLGER